MTELPKPEWMPPIQADLLKVNVFKRIPSESHFTANAQYGCAAEAWAYGKTELEALVNLKQDIKYRMEKLQISLELVNKELE